MASFLQTLPGPLCRICLSCDSRVVDILSTPVYDILERLTCITWHADDGFPHSVCYMCVALLRKCRRLQIAAHSADRILKEICSGNSGLSNLDYKNREAVGLTHGLSSVVFSSDESDIRCEIKEEIDTSDETKAAGINIGNEEIKLEITMVKENVSFNKEHEVKTNDELIDDYKVGHLEYNKRTECSDQLPQISNNEIEQAYQDPPEVSEIIQNNKSKAGFTNLEYSCIECKASFNEKLELIDHVMKLHRPPGAPPPRLPAGRRKCTYCPYATTNNTHFKYHILKHTGEKPFHCNICDFACARLGNLKLHLQRHSGEKLIKCDQCDYKCNETAKLRRHLRSHTGDKPFKCTQCDFRCSRSGNLKAHLLRHTGAKPYQCSECKYKASDSGKLKRHMRTHTGDRPFKCTECEYRCTQSSSVKRHMIRMHNPVKNSHRKGSERLTTSIVKNQSPEII